VVVTVVDVEAWTDDATIWPGLVELTACLCAELEEAQLPELCFCGVVPGADVAWDYVGTSGGDGMAWVRLVSVYPSTVFPTTDASLRSCATALAAQVELGVLRCAPNPQDDGTPPSAAAQWEATRLQMADMRAMYRAVKCCAAKGRQMVVGQYNPTGPRGGVVGGTWQVWVQQWQVT
jgi:hypothetical protein